MQSDIQTDLQIGRWADRRQSERERQTDGLAEILLDSQTERQKGKYSDGHIHRFTNTHIGRQTDRQTDR